MHARLGLLLAGLCLATPACSVEDCPALEKAFQREMEGKRIDSAEAQLEKMQTVCPQAVVRDDERFFTETVATEANDLAENKHWAEAEKLLKKARLDSWAVSSVRGYIASERPEGQRDWHEASSQYSHALELLTDPDDPKLKAIPNLKDMQQRLLALAAESQVIYGKADTSIQRDGSPQGVFKAVVRGVQAVSIPYPVHFDTDKASLTTEGQQSVDALAQFILGQRQFQSVTLTGHADPRGSTKHNQTLSEQRAETVARQLKGRLNANGVNIPIHTTGKGEFKPPELQFDLSEEETFRRWRRVELDFH